MTVTYEFTERISFENSNDMKLMRSALMKLRDNPCSVNMSEQDFSADEWDIIPYFIDLTRKGSFFELDNEDHVNLWYSIIEKINTRRKKAGFIKMNFIKEQLRVLKEAYDPLPKEPDEPKEPKVTKL